ncbi:hypothetical protein [Fluviicola taffensis]|uniref:Uncharacterized protein n=1 Tax=Fluviicola taffensis (strain DSM 16823 / NCIMB 13979 / RW262) TaxID=755732 RepID=F2IC79_FLUTR|nr:hypothetical protein [Fluviicola taffensis]AEA44325.1 hypothetical protein Fluta_2339 [Fluviicola taffensis DSM 16823]
MNKNFINCLYITTTLSLFSAFHSYGQQLDRHDDSIYQNQHITGVGTSTVVYHLTESLKDNVLVELENYLESMNAITQVDIQGLDVFIQFKEATTNEMIYPFIQRMEMLYINKNPKTR